MQHQPLSPDEVDRLLDDLPRLAPSPAFADRVVSGVRVAEPWYTPFAAAARRLVPGALWLRIVMTVTASVLAIAATSALAWLAFHPDTAGDIVSRTGEEATAVAAGVMRAAIEGVLGSGAAGMVESHGAAGAAISIAVLAGAACLAAFALGRLTAARRARDLP